MVVSFLGFWGAKTIFARTAASVTGTPDAQSDLTGKLGQECRPWHIGDVELEVVFVKTRQYVIYYAINSCVLLDPMVKVLTPAKGTASTSGIRDLFTDRSSQSF